MKTQIHVGLVAATGSFLAGFVGGLLLPALWPPILPWMISLVFMLFNLRIIEKAMNTKPDSSWLLKLVPFFSSFLFVVLGTIVGYYTSLAVFPIKLTA